MRIWSVHPRYLDRQGLIACWRETLLAQKVLAGQTRGYQHHPQLIRFRRLHIPDQAPMVAIAAYLEALADEADCRGYQFDRGRIATAVPPGYLTVPPVSVTEGQLAFEARHLALKISARNATWWDRVSESFQDTLDPHPLFTVIPGSTESWERSSEPAS